MSYCSKVTLTLAGDGRAAMSPMNGAVACSATPIGEFKASLRDTVNVSCRMYQVCTANVSLHYLEISPKIVWLLAGHTQNEVYSNTDWTIN